MRRWKWRQLDFEAETNWLGEVDESIAGFDANGWEASIWIAHAIYELPDAKTELTYDELHKNRVAAGLEEVHMIGDTNMTELSVATGIPMGVVGRPTEEWVRVSWSELASRTNTSLADQQYPPCFRWFTYKSWPLSLQPPPEGSLDEDSLAALIPHLISASPDDICIATYGLLATAMRYEPGACFQGPISKMPRLVNMDVGTGGSPSNIWAKDRSWFVYTDWDLWGTKVSGPRSLIDQIIADADLETLLWSEAS